MEKIAQEGISNKDREYKPPGGGGVEQNRQGCSCHILGFEI